MQTVRTALVLVIILLTAKISLGAPMLEKELKAKIARFVPTQITADVSTLPESEQKVLQKVIEASRFLDAIYLRQVWAGNVALAKTLSADTTARGRLVAHLFKQNVGPWSRLDNGAPFVEGVPAHKPKGGGFYPEDLSKEELEKWMGTLSEKEKAQASGFFSTIRRGSEGKLTSVPYSKEYQEFLEPAAKALKEAAELTQNATLKKFLQARAEAFLSDDYYASDVAWMEVDSPVDVTIGPYETYEDELMGFKAAFESFVTVRNEGETAKLKKFSSELQDIENHLPFDPKYRNPKIGALAPIRVVDQVFAAGEARRGVMTAAFNLPNDEKVVAEKGSKRVMLRNVQAAKFEKILKPISEVVIPASDRARVQFEPFFTHILMHELCHGLGPQSIKVNGTETTVRKELKEIYGAIEEAKADITGLWALQYLVDKGKIEKGLEKVMYETYLVGAFRSVRFGINEAHGKGLALQFNYLWDHGGIRLDHGGRFQVVHAKIKQAVAALSGEILTLQAEGNYAKAKALLEKYAVIRPEMKKLLDKLKKVPTDLEPVYPVAGE